jgi:hypothetical protein
MVGLCEITSIVANVCIILISAWLTVKYLGVKKCVNRYMDIDKLLDNIEEDLELETVDVGLYPTTHSNNSGGNTTPAGARWLTPSVERDRLIAVAAGGNAKLYLGKHITTSQIEKMDDKEVLKLYSRYEVYIGSVMTKSLKTTICGVYTTLMGLLVPSVSKGKYILIEGERLSESLTENPVINLALSTFTCGLYHEYGHYLAPLTAGLLTSAHVEVNPNIPEEVPVPPVNNVEVKSSVVIQVVEQDVSKIGQVIE